MLNDLHALSVSEQQSVNDQLLHAYQESQSLINAISDYSLVSIADPAGDIIYANDLFVSASGYTSEELIGQNHRIFRSHVQSSEFWTGMWKTIASGQVWRDVVCDQTKSGALRWYDTQITPVFNESGVIEQYVSIRTDITKLVETTEAAKAASLIKSQFLTNMSHEIRTPMNAILGMLKLLQKTELTPRQQEYISKADGASKSLLGLLNDILDFSKMEANKMTLDLQPFRVDRLVHDLWGSVAGGVGGKPVAVRIDIDPTLPKAFVGDALRLNQVLLNLSSNAVKFTEKGEVVIQIKKLAQTGADTTLLFSVLDTGIGIAPEHLELIFTGFTQADGSLTRRFGGTGLGLSISKQLVALMGGALDVESVLGKGSRFHFTISLTATDRMPVDPDMAINDRAARQHRLEGLRLLVVEDNLINQIVARELLRSEGAVVVVAGNGKLGVEAIIAAEFPFDAVLMDVQMPVMDGYTATRAIRTELGMTALPIIALTANDMASDRELCLMAGMDDHMGKPFNLPKLVEMLLRLTAAKGKA